MRSSNMVLRWHNCSEVPLSAFYIFNEAMTGTCVVNQYVCIRSYGPAGLIIWEPYSTEYRNVGSTSKAMICDKSSIVNIMGAAVSYFEAFSLMCFANSDDPRNKEVEKIQVPTNYPSTALLQMATLFVVQKFERKYGTCSLLLRGWRWSINRNKTWKYFICISIVSTSRLKEGHAGSWDSGLLFQ